LKSIKLKMIIYLGALLITVCAGLGISSYINAYNALAENAKMILAEVATQGAYRLSSQVEVQLSKLRAIANREVIMNPDIKWDEKKIILNQDVKDNGYKRLGIATTDGELLYSNGTTANILDRDYFKKAMSGQPAVSDPLVAKIDSSIIVVYAVPIKYDDNIIGVLVAATDGTSLSKETDSIVVGKTGSSFMINKQGTTIANKNRDLVINMDNNFENVKKDPSLQPLVEIEKQMVAGNSGFGEYTYQGVSKYVSYHQ